ncbi:MAG: hypothetical protein LBH32_13330 [Dysgonamonadaceae bacterium]|jgi:hypothetical protein|nr:hypothetical protein [Dysgonamonadaceae bacterium]
MRKNFLVKIFVILLLCFGANSKTIAQNTFSQGDKVINLGIGFLDNLGGSGYTKVVPPISASFEVGIKDELFDAKSSLGLGGYLGYAANKQEYEIPSQTVGGMTVGGGSYSFDYTYFIIGARGYLHYQLVDKLDTYGGLMLGYNIASSKSSGNVGSNVASSNGGFTWSLFVGGRYYFSDNLAGFLELGYGIASIQLGVAYKF